MPYYNELDILASGRYFAERDGRLAGLTTEALLEPKEGRRRPMSGYVRCAKSEIPEFTSLHLTRLLIFPLFCIVACIIQRMLCICLAGRGFLPLELEV